MLNSYGHHTWNGKPSPYWQHNEPINCPHGHRMGWLGGRFWLCAMCRPNTIWVEMVEEKSRDGAPQEQEP